MAEVTDILCDDSGDLACVDHDLAIGGSTLQHQADLLSVVEGEVKEWPATGVGITGYLNDEDPLAMVRKIRMQLTQDGMSVKNVQYSGNGNLIIEANY
jgi:hypothetical protein